MTQDAISSQLTEDGLVHEALLYRSEAELIDALTGFVADAAVAHEPVLVALPREHLERARDALGLRAGAVALQDMRELGRNPSCVLPAIQEWVEGHEGRTRVVAEAVWPGRGSPEIAECLRQEALLNHVLADAPTTVLCPYDAQHLDPATLSGAELTHPTVLEAGHRRPSATYRGPGELDLAQLWPLEPPLVPVFEHRFAGDLFDFRHEVAGDPLVSELSPERQADLVMAINEAATNAVQHGDHECMAQIWHDGRSVVTEVSTGARVAELLVGCRRPRPEAVSGRGLWLINQVCDLVQARGEAGGTLLRMHVRDA